MRPGCTTWLFDTSLRVESISTGHNPPIDDRGPLFHVNHVTGLHLVRHSTQASLLWAQVRPIDAWVLPLKSSTGRCGLAEHTLWPRRPIADTPPTSNGLDSPLAKTFARTVWITYGQRGGPRAVLSPQRTPLRRELAVSVQRPVAFQSNHHLFLGSKVDTSRHPAGIEMHVGSARDDGALTDD